MSKMLALTRLARQLRQLGDIRRNPPRFVAGERLGRCARIIEIDT
jgi:hypothetical protein